MSVQAPKTVGPNLAGLTTRDQAKQAWERIRDDERWKAERAARALALSIFGRVAIEFDDFVPVEFMRRFHLTPRSVVTFQIEGLRFNYRAALHGKNPSPERFWLIDECACGRGPRLLFSIEQLADLGRVLDTCDFAHLQCWWCDEDDADRKKGRARS